MARQRSGANPVHVDTDARTLLKLRRMGRGLRMTDQILSFDIERLSIVDNGRTGAPAWTSIDGADITIDASKMPSLDDRVGIAVWLGTNAHELFHNLYTPRSGSNLMRRIVAAERSHLPGIHRSWNVLEDQRIERLGLARYRAWRGYLVAALSHHIPYTHPQAWTLLAGRTWLPDEVRAIARGSFVATSDEATTRRVAELIGDYQRLAEPGDEDADEAWRIVDEFHRLVGSELPPRGGCGSKPIEAGEPEPNDDDSVAIPTADEADDDDLLDDEGDEGDESDDDADDDTDMGGDDGDDEGDESDDDEAEGDGDGDDDDEPDDDDDFGDEGDGSGGESADDDEADDEAEPDDDGEGDDGGVSDESGDGEAGDGIGGPTEDRSIGEAMADAIDEALDDDETSADLDRVADTVAHGATAGGNLPIKTGEWADATTEARLLARDVSMILTDIKDDNEAGWVRRTDHGRFSVDRWATEDWTADDVFDAFDPGAMDASALDVVLVVDVSGSMASEAQAVAEATWAIRTAVDRVEGECTVIGFGNEASSLFRQGQRPDGRLFLPHLEGSTVPDEACREAHRIVAGSTAANRIVIVLTDGEWWNPAPSEDALRAAQAEGAIVAIVGLGSGCRSVVPGFCGADVVAKITSGSELVPIFRDIAIRSMLAAAGRG